MKISSFLLFVSAFLVNAVVTVESSVEIIQSEQPQHQQIDEDAERRLGSSK